MEHPVMELLEDRHNSLDLLNKLQEQVQANQIELARMTSAKIEAINEIKFDLKKAINESNSRGHNEATGEAPTKA